MILYSLYNHVHLTSQQYRTSLRSKLGGNGRRRKRPTGEGVDSVKLTNLLRKRLGHATIVSVKDVKKKNKYNEGEDDDDKSSLEYFRYCYSRYPPTPHCYQQVVYDPQPYNSCSIL
ncbi:hypothetical protein QN277_016860 [Acacia crassicarpa]|uniref:Uncharacterized protein n=1 Tax=Acacia crassicarpa TaxID=499986 RepID=A0AAE1MXE9_9FABA|nr:hypothetical protein QN277_016860 [Acacia crassicarpa]